jgi:hypothetical protein
MAEQIEVVIIGGGQAGLALSYYTFIPYTQMIPIPTCSVIAGHASS